MQDLAERKESNCLKVKTSLCPVHTQTLCIHTECARKQLTGVKAPISSPLGQTGGQIFTTHNLVNKTQKCFTGIQISQPLSWVSILELLPLLSENFYSFLQNNFNLQRIIIKIGKVLMFALPMDIIKEVWLVSQWADGPLPIGHGRSMGNCVRKLCFLTLIKRANLLFPCCSKAQVYIPGGDQPGLHKILHWSAKEDLPDNRHPCYWERWKIIFPPLHGVAHSHWLLLAYPCPTISDTPVDDYWPFCCYRLESKKNSEQFSEILSKVFDKEPARKALSTLPERPRNSPVSGPRISPLLWGCCRPLHRSLCTESRKGQAQTKLSSLPAA